MDSFSDDGSEYRFFDARECIASVSDLGSGCHQCHHHHPDSGVDNLETTNFNYDVWIRSPKSVSERRSEFLRWMGLNSDMVPGGDDAVDLGSDEDAFGEQIDRVTENSGAVLRNSIFEDEFSSSRSTGSSCSTSASCSAMKLGSNENFVGRCCNSDGAREFNNNDVLEDCDLEEHQVLGVNFLQRDEQFKDSSAVPASSQQFVQRESPVDGHTAKIVERLKNRWLRRIRSMSCISLQHESAEQFGTTNGSSFPVRVQRVKVRQNRKQFKELSALFKGQDILAHKGAILTMKFSLDGQYLASAGDDRIVRVWKVVEDERTNETDLPDIDPSCLYFTVNNLSELAPLVADKEKTGKTRSLRKTPDSACIIFPPNVFRILEEPLHVFRGHTAEILDLSWSQNNCLLSSSIDKTVCLWQVGRDQCLKVFPHSNYVTCIQFNPVNDDYFISGSIDGKVRIWEISGRRVIDWIDVRDIVTAVSYRPDAKGGIIGSMTGTCRLFSVADNHLQLEEQTCLISKRKSPCKRITSFQFFPKDPSKVMVTSADAQVRIISGIDVIRKYKGPRSAGNHNSAFFSPDGKHIISTCEDSNVYMWDCSTLDDTAPCEPKTIRSFECFTSDASIAIPWFGLSISNTDDGGQVCGPEQNPTTRLPFSSACFTLSQDLFLESFPRGSATWPEEKLPKSSSPSLSSSMHKSQYKFLKSSFQSSSNSHAWGMVIVTAGWDGRIRSFHNYGLPIPH